MLQCICFEAQAFLTNPEVKLCISLDKVGCHQAQLFNYAKGELLILKGDNWSFEPLLSEGFQV